MGADGERQRQVGLVARFADPMPNPNPGPKPKTSPSPNPKPSPLTLTPSLTPHPDTHPYPSSKQAGVPTAGLLGTRRCSG